MIFYGLIFLLLSALGFRLDLKSQRGTTLFVLLALLWFMGWRYQVGCDFSGYLNRFNNVDPYANPLELLAEAEGAFLFITAFLRVNDYAYVWLNIAASAIILAGYYRYFRISQQPIAELALLFPVIILQLSMSGLRQGIAVALLTAACAEFLKGRRVGTALWIVVAVQFHSSAAVFLPLAFLAGKSVSAFRILAACIVLAPIGGLLLGDSAGGYRDQYVLQIYGESSSGGAVFRYLMILLPAVYFWIFRERFAEVLPRRFALFQIFALAIFALAPLFLVSSLVVHRLSFYFMPVSIMIAASAFRVPPVGASRDMIKLVPFVIYGVYLVAWLGLSKHASLCYIPYQSYSFQ